MVVVAGLVVLLSRLTNNKAKGRKEGRADGGRYGETNTVLFGMDWLFIQIFLIRILSQLRRKGINLFRFTVCVLPPPAFIPFLNSPTC
jgi:hypothetical protein